MVLDLRIGLMEILLMCLDIASKPSKCWIKKHEYLCTPTYMYVHYIFRYVHHAIYLFCVDFSL